MFTKEIHQYNWDSIQQQFATFTSSDVQQSLLNTHKNLHDFAVLISPAATPFLEDLIPLSQKITQERFGKNIQLFEPMYLSNECKNICTYCGFSFTNKIPRKTLNNSEILKEIEIIKSYGYDNILLVTGEHDKLVGFDYLMNAITISNQHFSQVSIEVQPLSQQEYEHLKNNGLYAVLVYQESYHRETYKSYHPKGKKSNFEYRLETPDRLGKAGVYKIGLGVLLGLEDWRTDSYFNAAHLLYMQRTYWKTKYSVSFPRIRPHEGEFKAKSQMTEKELLQLICAYRICFPDVELSLSTRERPLFRDIALECGITSMSAGSKTEPGGYSNSEALKQFEINDERSTEEIATIIRNKNYEVVWKDWDAVLA